MVQHSPKDSPNTQRWIKPPLKPTEQWNKLYHPKFPPPFYPPLTEPKIEECKEGGWKK